MPRPALPPGEHGLIAVRPSGDSNRKHGAFVATCRWHNPLKQRVEQVRRYGATADLAEDALKSTMAIRKAAPTGRPVAATFGEYFDWWWTNVRISREWAETTSAILGAIRRNHLAELDAIQLSSLRIEQVEEVVSRIDGARVRDYAGQLVGQVIADAILRGSLPSQR